DMLKYLQQHITPNVEGSLCNSAGIVNFSEHHHDWVRPGIMLYGSSPVIDQSADDLNLRPAMEFSARIMAMHIVNTGEAIGYGSRWTAEQDTRTALVSIGYGDGYPRVISDDAYVCIVDANSNISYHCPIRGRVAMDMIVVDLSAAPVDIALDSKVVLWGTMPHVDEVASHAGTIGYELLCRLSARPKRA
ncbi:alanine racemase C-terminal domain-containing protein, partial [Psychrobacter sp. 1U2]